MIGDADDKRIIARRRVNVIELEIMLMLVRIGRDEQRHDRAVAIVHDPALSRYSALLLTVVCHE